ncbi:MAG: flagellar biosynthetic protein FliO [Sneathiella sp.]|nr:flagellar biosynthetic protein FliO [Sneathiella sp.]
MEFLPYLKYILGLLFVLGLIGLITVAARKFGMVANADSRRSDKKRLGVTSVFSVDAKRRLILIRRDDREHLVLLGTERDLLIESNIPIKRKQSDTEDSGNELEEADDTAPKYPTIPSPFKKKQRQTNE